MKSLLSFLKGLLEDSSFFLEESSRRVFDRPSHIADEVVPRGQGQSRGDRGLQGCVLRLRACARSMRTLRRHVLAGIKFR